MTRSALIGIAALVSTCTAGHRAANVSETQPTAVQTTVVATTTSTPVARDTSTPSADELPVRACSEPCTPGRIRRGVVRCVLDDGTVDRVVGTVNCPNVRLVQGRNDPVCASHTVETKCVEPDVCLAMPSTCCTEDNSLVRPTGALGNSFCGSPGQQCSRCRCLPGDVHIATPAGERLLRDIEPGDTVWTQSTDGKRRATTVRETVRVPAPAGHRALEIELADGRIVHASPTHPAVDGTPLQQLKVGDLLDGSRIVRIQKGKPLPATYDLRTRDGEIYWADDVPLRTTIPD